jgi:hypothetical protein
VTGLMNSPDELGLRIAQADLGYVRGALDSGLVERGIVFFPHAVLVAFEAHAFCTRQLRMALPELAWNDDVAAAARTSGKLFDDNRRTLDDLQVEVARIAAATRDAYRGGWRRKLGRRLGIANPDLSVLVVDGVPLTTNVTAAFHAGGQHHDPAHAAAGREVMHDLAQGVGQMVAALGVADERHLAPGAGLEHGLEWFDGDSVLCYAEAFVGEVPSEAVPLLVLLQGAAATAAMLASTDCCDACRFAAFKQRLVVTYHLARSLAKVQVAGPSGGAAGKVAEDLLADQDIAAVSALRRLRNGLVHLGLSDAPVDVFTSAEPTVAIVEHYAGRRAFGDVDALVSRALERITDRLTTWMLAAPLGGVGLAALLKPPED